MPNYMNVAADANETAKNLMDLVPDANKPAAAELIARLVNFGIRCSPRGVQHTVRFNAVRRAVQGLPVHVGMAQRTNDRGYSYNALVTRPEGGAETSEGDTGD